MASIKINYYFLVFKEFIFALFVITIPIWLISISALYFYENTDIGHHELSFLASSEFMSENKKDLIENQLKMYGHITRGQLERIMEGEPKEQAHFFEKNRSRN
jgi:hypothetical protein